MSPALRNHYFFSVFTKSLFNTPWQMYCLSFYSDRWHYKNWKAISGSSMVKQRHPMRIQDWVNVHVCTSNSCSLISVWSRRSPRCPLSSVSPPRWSHLRLLQRISVCKDTMKQDWIQTLWMASKSQNLWYFVEASCFSPVNISQCQFLFESQIMCT